MKHLTLLGLFAGIGALMWLVLHCAGCGGSSSGSNNAGACTAPSGSWQLTMDTTQAGCSSSVLQSVDITQASDKCSVTATTEQQSCHFGYVADCTDGTVGVYSVTTQPDDTLTGSLVVSDGSDGGVPCSFDLFGHRN